MGTIPTVTVHDLKQHGQQTYRHTDIQTYSHTVIQTYRQTDIQTYSRVLQRCNSIANMATKDLCWCCVLVALKKKWARFQP
jgi:hypothetical protein